MTLSAPVPMLQDLPSIHGPSPVPTDALAGAAAFRAARTAYDAGDALTAARGFMRAAALIVAERPAAYANDLEEQAALAYDNAAVAFEAAGAAGEGRAAFAGVKDAPNAVKLDALAARLGRE